MTDTGTDQSTGKDQQNSTGQSVETERKLPKVSALGQFIQDISFENIAAQKNVRMNGQPDIGIQVGVSARKQDDEKRFSVTIKLKVEAKTKGDNPEPIFIVEMDYTGIFAIENVAENQIHPLLLVECPQIMFPYVRRIVGDVTRDGGFPPVNLENIDFLNMYQNDLKRQAQARENANGTQDSAANGSGNS